MSFELLDNLLTENGYTTDVDADEDYFVENDDSLEAEATEATEAIEEGDKEDAALYADLDTLVESAMRESLRDLIFEMDLVDSDRVEQLMIVENATFSDDQALKYMEETVTPIVELADLSAPAYETVSVASPVYEAALALWWHEMGGREFFEEDTAEETSGLYESVFGDKAPTYVPEGVDEFDHSLRSEMESIFEAYDLGGLEEREYVVESAIFALEEHGIEGLSADVDDVSDIVQHYNRLTEMDETMPGILDILREAEEKSRIKKGWGWTKGKAGAGKDYVAGKAGAVKDRFTKAGRAEAAKKAEANKKKKSAARIKKVTAQEKQKGIKRSQKGLAKQTAAAQQQAINVGAKKGASATEKAYSKEAKRERGTAIKAPIAKKIAAVQQKAKERKAGGFIRRNIASPIERVRTSLLKRKEKRQLTASKRTTKQKVGRGGLKAAAGAAVAAGAMMAYKKLKNRKCAGLSGDQKSACMKAAASKGLASATAAARKNPGSKSLQREVEKWRGKVAKY